MQVAIFVVSLPPMKIIDTISQLFSRKHNILISRNDGVLGGIVCTKYPFGRLVFTNAVELLTDLVNDVTLAAKAGDAMTAAALKLFFQKSGKLLLTRLFEQGFQVIGFDGTRFWLMSSQEYTTVSETDVTLVQPYDSNVQVYVMRSDTFQVYGMSDRQMCLPAIKLLDAALNATTTTCERLGAVVIGTPSTPSGSPVTSVLGKKEKEALEKEVQEKYGALNRQSQIMILPNDMKFSTINLAGLDMKMSERVKTAVLMIADRVKVPANQIGLIDAMSSKSLANGTELREGDYNKYQSFERLLNETFIEMASFYGVNFDYDIYNKPIRQTQQGI